MSDQMNTGAATAPAKRGRPAGQKNRQTNSQQSGQLGQQQAGSGNTGDGSGTANRPAPKPAVRKRARRRKQTGTMNRPAGLEQQTGTGAALATAHAPNVIVGGIPALTFTGERWNGSENQQSFMRRTRQQFENSLDSYVNHVTISHRPLVGATGGRTQ